MTSTRKQFRCTLRTRSSLYRDPDAFARMWSVLATPEVGAVTFDHFERSHRYDFTPDPSAALKLLDEHPGIFVKGDRDGFLLDGTSGGSGTYRTSIYLDAAAVDGTRWIPWILRLVGEIPVLFGGGCSLVEHDAKHRTAEELAGGGSAEGAIGVSNAEFQKYLPGTYWLTLFGPELAEVLDFSGLPQLPVTVTTLANDARAVQLDEPLAPKDMTKRMELEARIADALGASYFFDRDRKDIEFAHPPAFQDVLDKLARRR